MTSDSLLAHIQDSQRSRYCVVPRDFATCSRAASVDNAAPARCCLLLLGGRDGAPDGRQQHVRRDRFLQIAGNVGAGKTIKDF